MRNYKWKRTDQYIDHRNPTENYNEWSLYEYRCTDGCPHETRTGWLIRRVGIDKWEILDSEGHERYALKDHFASIKKEAEQCYAHGDIDYAGMDIIYVANDYIPERFKFQREALLNGHLSGVLDQPSARGSLAKSWHRAVQNLRMKLDFDFGVSAERVKVSAVDRQVMTVWAYKDSDERVQFKISREN